MIAWTIYISFLGVAAMLMLNRGNDRVPRVVALVTAIAGLIIAFMGTFEYRAGSGIVTITRLSWIPTLGVCYYLAADGISLTLVLLTGIAAVVGVLFSWNIEHRAKEFF